MIRFWDLCEAIDELLCDRTLKQTKEFCEKNKADFRKLKRMLEDKGGYCDCEVIMNCVGRIDYNKPLPRRKT